MGLIELLFGFRGRVGRGGFWLAAAIWFGVLALAVGIVLSKGTYAAAVGAMILAYLPVLVSAVAVGMKRLHDRDKSAWWLLPFYGAPLATPTLVALVTDLGGAGIAGVAMALSAFGYAALAVALWATVELGMLRGTVGANRHGPDPVAPRPESAAH